MVSGSGVSTSTGGRDLVRVLAGISTFVFDGATVLGRLFVLGSSSFSALGSGVLLGALRLTGAGRGVGVSAMGNGSAGSRSARERDLDLSFTIAGSGFSGNGAGAGLARECDLDLSCRERDLEVARAGTDTALSFISSGS